MISTLERTLHRSLYDHLVQIYGDGKDWWRDGIPREVRAEASSRFELDTYPSDFTEGSQFHLIDIVIQILSICTTS